VQHIRVWVETMGSPKCRIVGKSQSGLIMIDPIISTRTRTLRCHPEAVCDLAAAEQAWDAGIPSVPVDTRRGTLPTSST
jgi:hypothetical protein